MTRQLPTTAVCIVTTGLVVDNYDMNVYAIIYTAERKSGREREGERRERERDYCLWVLLCDILFLPSSASEWTNRARPLCTYSALYAYINMYAHKSVNQFRVWDVLISLPLVTTLNITT